MPDHDSYYTDKNDKWGGDWNGGTAIPQFRNKYKQTYADYYRGIGNILDYPNGIDNVIDSALALDAMSNVVAAWKSLGSQYASNPSTVATTPVDLIRYSRGAMQAMALANLIATDGVPDPASHYLATVTTVTFVHRVQQLESHQVDAWHTYLHPTIRFVGLLSPVYMQGFDSVIAELSFGQIDGLNLGWPTSLPSGVGDAVILHDANPNQVDPPRVEETITGGNSATNTAPYPNAHGDLGLHTSVLNDLIHYANQDNVPIEDTVGGLSR